MATALDADEMLVDVKSSKDELMVRSLSMMAYGSLNSVPRFRAKSRPSSSLVTSSHITHSGYLQQSNIYFNIYYVYITIYLFNIHLVP